MKHYIVQTNTLQTLNYINKLNIDINKLQELEAGLGFPGISLEARKKLISGIKNSACICSYFRIGNIIYAQPFGLQPAAQNSETYTTPDVVVIDLTDEFSEKRVPLIQDEGYLLYVSDDTLLFLESLDVKKIHKYYFLISIVFEQSKYLTKPLTLFTGIQLIPSIDVVLKTIISSIFSNDANKLLEYATIRQGNTFYFFTALKEVADFLQIPNTFTYDYNPISYANLFSYSMEDSSDFWIISAVLEINNTRLAAFNHLLGRMIKLYSLDTSNKYYSFLDIGRLFKNPKKLITDDKTNLYIATDVNIAATLVNEKNLNYVLQRTELFFNAEDLKNAADSLKAFQQKEQQESQDYRLLRDKLNLKISNVHNKSFYYNDIEFSKDQITYEDQIFKINSGLTDFFDNYFYKIYQITDRIINRDFIYLVNDFLVSINNIYENATSYTRYSYETVKAVSFFTKRVDHYSPKVALTVGNIPITIEHSCVPSKTVGSEHWSHIVKINGFKINKDDRLACLKAALTYDDLKSYNNFLKLTAKLSLSTQQYLQNGIEVKIENPLDSITIDGIQPDSTIKIKLQFQLGTRGKNLKINNKYFPIHDFNTFVNKFKRESTHKMHITTFINILLDTKLISNITAEDIAHLIQEGALLIKQKTAFITNMLDSLIEKYKIQRVTSNYILLNGKIVTAGFIITTSKNKYIIDTKMHNNVYTYPEGKYLCMIDKGTQTEGLSQLINRILALVNDTKVAHMIETLN